MKKEAPEAEEAEKETKVRKRSRSRSASREKNDKKSPQLPVKIETTK